MILREYNCTHNKCLINSCPSMEFCILLSLLRFKKQKDVLMTPSTLGNSSLFVWGGGGGWVSEWLRHNLNLIWGSPLRCTLAHVYLLLLLDLCHIWVYSLVTLPAGHKKYYSTKNGNSTTSDRLCRLPEPEGLHFPYLWHLPCAHFFSKDF